MDLMIPLLFFPLGVAAWSLAEYLLHRFWFHGLRGKGLGSREHLEHHAGIDNGFGTTLLSWAGVWAVGAVVFAPLGWLLAGVVAGVSVGLGWVVGYYFYEYHHWDAHRRGPRSRYTRWVRRHHLHHHFGAPKRNHGVTSPVWDHVFGTYDDPGRIRLPRRMVELSVPWLLGSDGEVLREWMDDYEVVGRRDRTTRSDDRDLLDAFASIAPEFDDESAPVPVG